jgi:hypothetical protein
MRRHRVAATPPRRAAFLAPPVHANPLHPRSRRSPPVAAEPPCRLTPTSTPRRVTRRHPLRHELCRAAVHAPVSPRHAFPVRLPCAGEVATSRACCAAARRHACLCPRRALRWPRSSWARLGHARAMQAGCAGTVQLG